MTSDTDRISADQGRPPIWRNGTFLKWAAQLVVLATLLVAAYIVIGTALRNLEAQGLSFDWDFLGDPVGFSVGGTATAGSDYQPVGRTVAFAPGANPAANSVAMEQVSLTTVLWDEAACSTRSTAIRPM